MHQMSNPDEQKRSWYEEDEIDLLEIFETLWKKRWTVLLVMALCLALGIGYALLTPRQYQSRTVLLVMPPIPAELSDATDAATASNMASFLAPDIHKDLAVARDLLQEAIDTAFPAGDKRPTVEDLASNLSIQVNKSSEDKRQGNIPSSLSLTASLEGTDPAALPLFLSAWSKAYIRKNAQLFSNRVAQSFEYIQEAFATTKKNLETAENALLAFQRENPADALELQVKGMKEEYAAALEEYARKMAELDPLEAEMAAVRESLASEPEKLTVRRGLSAEALWNFLDQRPNARELERMQGLDVTEESPNPNYLSLKAKLHDLNARVASVKSSIGNAERRLARIAVDLAEKQQQYQEIVVRAERLVRERDTLKEFYGMLAKKYQASSIAVAEAADSIRVIEQPVVPTKPVAPNRKLIVALSGVLGVFAGIFGALITAFVEDRRQKREAPRA